MTEKGD